MWPKLLMKGVKKDMYCPRCGSENEEGRPICHRCGTSLRNLKPLGSHRTILGMERGYAKRLILAFLIGLGLVMLLLAILFLLVPEPEPLAVSMTSVPGRCLTASPTSLMQPSQFKVPCPLIDVLGYDKSIGQTANL